MLNKKSGLSSNGQKKINLWKKVSARVGKMDVSRINMCMVECSRRVVTSEKCRKFIMSITMCGAEPLKYKISQIALDKDELIQIRDSINELLND